jgi:hypothetical protein
VNEDRPEKPGAGAERRGGDIPPSAAGQLEPYGAQVWVQPTSRGLEPQHFLTVLLEDLAASCVASGASVIGHLKCLLYTPGGVLACNLTSVLSGAQYTARDEDATNVLGPDDSARLDLVVLVYGLPAATIDALLRRALNCLLEPLEVAWSIGGVGEALHEAT